MTLSQWTLAFVIACATLVPRAASAQEVLATQSTRSVAAPSDGLVGVRITAVYERFDIGFEEQVVVPFEYYGYGRQPRAPRVQIRWVCSTPCTVRLPVGPIGIATRSSDRNTRVLPVVVPEHGAVFVVHPADESRGAGVGFTVLGGVVAVGCVLLHVASLVLWASASSATRESVQAGADIGIGIGVLIAGGGVAMLASASPRKITERGSQPSARASLAPHAFGSVSPTVGGALVGGGFTF